MGGRPRIPTTTLQTLSAGDKSVPLSTMLAIGYALLLTLLLHSQIKLNIGVIAPWVLVDQRRDAINKKYREVHMLEYRVTRQSWRQKANAFANQCSPFCIASIPP
jgi:hypothetical protein